MRAFAWLTVCVLGCCLSGLQIARAEDQPTAAPSAKLASQGKSLYKQFCQNCHGVNMVNPGTSSFDLRKFPHDDKARFVNSVTHGKNTMPAWGDILHPEEIDEIWAYILTGGQT